MRLTAVLMGALTVCPIATGVAQILSPSDPGVNSTDLALSGVTDNRFGGRTFPLIIGPGAGFARSSDTCGLGIGQQGFGTTIGEQGTTAVPVLGPRDRLTNFGLVGGPAGFATAVSPHGFGFIGPQGFNPRVGSQTIALAINAQGSSITIGGVGIGNSVNTTTPATQPMQTVRIVPIAQSPNNIFAGRIVTTSPGAVRGR